MHNFADRNKQKQCNLSFKARHSNITIIPLKVEDVVLKCRQLG